MPQPAATSAHSESEILGLIRQFWGFDSLRPLQSQAIAASLATRDSLVVMPTGGGKSLCYQVPPLAAGRTDVVVSPLISLMKDQVDALRQVGYPAAALNSGIDAGERRQIESDLRAGKLRLVFVAPERVLSPWFLQLARHAEVRSFAIDEAHCISQWGHDFRPEYRQLAILREHFPGVSLHAFTATATQRVQDDIVAQLGLRDPAILVGTFDRPNLVFRILPQVDLDRQMLEVIGRHEGEAVIVYCISRKDTEVTAAALRRHGVKAAHYHAGMDAGARRRTQEDFSAERVDVVVATVAFGMGIDRSNVRCVVHAAMPKTIENYQQEAGRAGRDGLEAQCVLLYSPADVIRWESLIRKSDSEGDKPPEVIKAQLALLRQMQRLCASTDCRHKALSEYFGQSYDKPNCGACDVCLGEVEGVADSTVLAQKILSCVARTGQRFGAGHVVDVLAGADTERIRSYAHEQLSTYALLKDMSRKQLMSMVYQLIDQGLLSRTDDDRPVLSLNDDSWQVLRGHKQVRLVQPKRAAERKSKVDRQSWDGVDRALFERLRQVRRDLATARGVPAYVIFDDATLRELARLKPTTLQAMRHVRGVGDKRLAEFGERMVGEITAFSQKPA